MSKDELVALVLEQISQDVEDRNTDPLYSMLMSVTTDQLVAFLPQDSQRYIAG